MPVTNVGSRWSSGDLIFYEKNVSLGTIGNILTIGDDAVTVGSATNDINFSWLGDTTGTFVLDAGAHTLAMTGLAISADGAVTLGIDASTSLTVGTSGDPVAYAADGDINVAVYSDYTKVDGFFRGLYALSNYKPTGLSGAASVYGIRGHAVLPATYIFVGGGSEMLTGVHGLTTLSGTVNDATADIQGVRGEVNGTPTLLTTLKFMSGVEAKCGINTAVTAGKYAAFLGYSHVTTAALWPDAMAYFWGYYQDGIDFSGWAGNPTTGYAFVFGGGANRGTTAGAFTNDTVAGTTQDGYIRIKVGATAAKVPYWFDD